MPNLEIAGQTSLSLPEDQPLRRAVRRLRWFRSTFETELTTIEKRTGIAYHLDTPKLTRCFIRWLQAFDAQKPHTPDQRHAYVGFAAGLMLRQLLIEQPLSVDTMPTPIDPDLPAHYWPEGYAYVTYCLNVRTAVIMEEYKEETPFSPALGEIRTWQTFRENVQKDPSTALAFLDLFAGLEPDWTMPSIFKGEPRTAPALVSFGLKVLSNSSEDL